MFGAFNKELNKQRRAEREAAAHTGLTQSGNKNMYTRTNILVSETCNGY